VRFFSESEKIKAPCLLESKQMICLMGIFTSKRLGDLFSSLFDAYA
jgi:hypothetical protein